MTRRTESRKATVDDAADIARLFTEFNVEFDEPTPEVGVAAERVTEHIREEQSTFLLIGDGPDGFAQLRYQTSLYSAGLEAHLQELYIVPSKRGQGLGRSLLEAAMEEARSRGADYIHLGTSEDDEVAMALYESAGFTNREKPPDGPVMYVYEREL
jgi:ribosomal protein S18 acetylase RimI-like enzyme